MIAFFLTPAAANSQTTQDDLMQQINQMKQQVNQLQEQIVNQSRGSSSSRPSGVSVNQSNSIEISSLSSLQPFTRNLSRGDRGAEVKRLQQVLNQLLPAPVAATGPGSVGQETSYYGPATAGAVIRFQELHAADVLAPLDLQQGTGFLGNSTRAKLNHLLALEAQEAGDDVASTPSFDANSQATANTLRADDEEVESEVAELENTVNLDKWDLTDREKRQIVMSVPEGIRGDYFPDYVGSSNTNDPRNNNNDTYDNPLQREYQRRLELQSSAVDMLRSMSVSYVTEPLQRLQHSLAKVFGPAETANAQFGLVFGGRVGAVFPCTCNPPAISFTVIGARPVSTTYFPAVTQKSPPTPPLPGAGTLGNYTPFGICLIGVPPACAPAPAFGTAIIMGTSY